MEPKNHPIEKENHLPNHHDFRFHVNLPGCTGFVAVAHFSNTKKPDAKLRQRVVGASEADFTSESLCFEKDTSKVGGQFSKG